MRSLYFNSTMMKEICENELKYVTGGMTKQECDQQTAYIKAEIDRLNNESAVDLNRMNNPERHNSYEEVIPLQGHKIARNARLEELGLELSRLAGLCINPED